MHTTPHTTAPTVTRNWEDDSDAEESLAQENAFLSNPHANPHGVFSLLGFAFEMEESEGYYND